MKKVYLNVEIHNNREFVVWRTENGTAIATLCNTTKGGYLVNTARVAFKDMKGMDIYYSFCDLSNAIVSTEYKIEKEFGKCSFIRTENYEKWQERTA